MISQPELRLAELADLPAIVALLRDDALGQKRESEPGDPIYADAFALISRDANNHLYVAESDGIVVGCAQLTFIPGIARRATTALSLKRFAYPASTAAKGWAMS